MAAKAIEELTDQADIALFERYPQVEGFLRRRIPGEFGEMESTADQSPLVMVVRVGSNEMAKMPARYDDTPPANGAIVLSDDAMRIAIEQLPLTDMNRHIVTLWNERRRCRGLPTVEFGSAAGSALRQ